MRRSAASKTRAIHVAIGQAVAQGRRDHGWSQEQLGVHCDVGQSAISSVEHAAVPELKIATAVAILDALDIDVEVVLRLPHVSSPRGQRDATHARCVYVARQLERAGWTVATEVEVTTGRSLGWIDILAFHPVERVLLVIEVKTEILDVGAVQRQLGWYEREARSSAHRLGWRPWAATSILLLLATRENDALLQANRALYDREFQVRAHELQSLIRSPKVPPARGMRGLAMIDPRGRRRDWLLSTWLDGRRTAARYATRAAFLAAPRRADRA